ncbi:autotransporter domain-containing protein [Ancylobacter sp.]|uniref:autotransporter domain-containing protein n=1 Tax=Ancylobacter sp. TaxID=1872567 RepID=UPI003D10F96E
MSAIRTPLRVAGLVMSGGVWLASPSPAQAACTNAGTVTYEGAVTILTCTDERLSATATGPAATLNVDNGYFDSATNGGPGILFKADDDAANPTDITLNLTGSTTVLGQHYDGVDLRTVRGDITVNIGEGVLISPDQTGVYVASTEPGSWPDGDTYVGGNVTITNRGTVIAGASPDPMGTNGILGLANGGGVSISNYGTVTTTYTGYNAWDTYGILADGGHAAPEPVAVSIYNDGTVTSLNDGLRVNSYNGLASVVNDVHGVVTSNGRRGVVVWSDKNSAIFTNYGTVTSYDGPGANVWAGGSVSGDAILVNSGSIVSHDNPDRTVYTTLYNGVHIWSQTSGKAELVNLAGGRIVAPDGWGAWLMSTDGDVVVDNAGLIKGASTALQIGAQGGSAIVGDVPAYEGAMGGDLTVTNRGILTAFATVADPQGTFGLVTLAGDVGTATFTNAAGGIVGAGLELDEGFDAARIATMSMAELGGLSDAAGNLAIFAAIKADEVDIANAGLMFGRIVVETPAAVSEGVDVPAETGVVEVRNSGTWVVTGVSSITPNAVSGVFSNSGALWALDDTGFEGDVANSGALHLVSTGPEAGATTVFGDYAARGAARLLLHSSPSTGLSALPGLTIEGDVSGRTQVLLANPVQLATLDWRGTAPITVVTVEGAAPAGAGHFYMDQDVGLVSYGLDYAAGDNETWSLTRGLNVDAAAALSDTAYAARNLLTLSTQLVTERIDDLRDSFFAGMPVPAAPMAYAPTKAPSSAFSGVDKPSPSPTARAWLKASGMTSTGDGYDMDTGIFQGGVDLAREVGRDFAAAGLIAGYGRSTLDFDATGTDATVDGPVFGAYGSYVTEGGVFVNGILMGQVFDVDMNLASVATDFSGSSVGGRVETGIRLDYGELLVEPSVAMQASYTSFDTVDVANIAAGFDDTTGLAAEGRLRVAMNIQRETVLLKPYAIATLGYEFLADDNVVVSALDTSYVGDQKGLYGDVSAGLAVSNLANSYGGFVQGSFDFSEDRTGVGIKLGGQLRF